MTPSTLHLASTLISHAAGFTSHAAAAELICAHHTWLTRDDFTATCIRSGTSHDQYPWAYWEQVITALDSHQLSCSPSEAGILRIAASLGDHHIPVHLARVLGSLDLSRHPSCPPSTTPTCPSNATRNSHPAEMCPVHSPTCVFQ